MMWSHATSRRKGYAAGVTFRLLLLVPFLTVAAELVGQDGGASAFLDELQTWLKLPAGERTAKYPVSAVPRAAVDRAIDMVFVTLKSEAKNARSSELASSKVKGRGGATRLRTVKAAGREMKVYERVFGKEPKGGHSLWISMHGGGGAPAKVNDQQWRNQIQLYQPQEGVYVAPRAPTNTWNLWHEGHIDALFDRLIENYIVTHGINPDRVYLMGYSAGGDGVYKLAPRMADRFAAASMMAGHPNGEPMMGTRNLPFMIWMGEKDGAYSRNKMAVQWGEKLDALAKGDPDGYVHETHIVAGKGHWMDRADRAAVPWMAQHTRSPWPKKVVWRQNARTHDRFYWLAMPAGDAQGGQTVRAELNGQAITLATTQTKGLRLRLSDHLLDLDQKLTVDRNGERVFEGIVERSVRAIYESLQERLDPASAAVAIVELTQ